MMSEFKNDEKGRLVSYDKEAFSKMSDEELRAVFIEAFKESIRRTEHEMKSFEHEEPIESDTGYSDE